jgi:hypothetical protein
MKSIFWLELVAFLRSKSFLLLTVASAVIPFVFSSLVKTDGTLDGERTIKVYYSLSAVLSIVLLTVAVATASSLSKERKSKLLQLTLIRPVSFFCVVMGKMLAQCIVCMVALAVGVAAVSFLDDSDCCRHVLRPVMISPREEAVKMYEVFMADPNLPKEVRTAKKSEVLKLLERRAHDHYFPMPTNTVTKWDFKIPENFLGREVALRIRFSDYFSLRNDVCGEFVFSSNVAPVTNITQAILEMPLGKYESKSSELKFSNYGTSSLMLRPRRDIELLFSADGKWMNYLRAYIVMSSMIFAVAAFGMLLGAVLSRPVAIWTIVSLLFLSVASPAVVDQYPIELNIKSSDAIGLGLSRFVEQVTSPLNTFSPITNLSNKEYIEFDVLANAVAVNVFVLPGVFTLLSSFVLLRVKI